MNRAQKIDRRAFLKLSGCAGAAATLPLVSPAIGLAALPGRRGGLHAAQYTRPLMGTVVTVTVVDPSPGRARDALEAGFARMAELTPLFDRHGGDGPLAVLNREGRLDEVSPELASVLDLCGSVHQWSRGAFDITVAPVLDAFKKSFAAGGPPDSRELHQALAALGGLKRENGGLRLTREGAAVTLDGVAKGFIADQAVKAMARAGARHALVNAGGDIAVLGDRGGVPWRVGVTNPRRRHEASLVVEMTGGALATSGDYEVFFDREKLYHHIINPADGTSPRTDLSASVRAPSAVLADALSTACFVLNPRQAMRLLQARPGLEGLIYTRQGQRYQTPGFKA